MLGEKPIGHLQVSVNAVASLTRHCNNGGEHCCHLHGGNLCSEGEVLLMKKRFEVIFREIATMTENVRVSLSAARITA